MPPSSSSNLASSPSIALVKRAQEGDREALELLFERYYPRLRRIVRIRMGKHLRSRVESVDILQETFAVAVMAFDRFEMRDESSLIHWLGKLAENQIRGALDHFAAARRDARREVPLVVEGASSQVREFAHEPEEERPQPVDLLVKDEDRERLEACMDELREEYREVVIHRYLVGADWATIASWMDLPSADAARMRCARAMMELERLLGRRQG